MNQLQATGQLVRDVFWNWVQMRKMPPQAIDQMARLIGDEYALLPGGAVYVGGQFIVPGDISHWGDLKCDYIAQWNGDGWSEIGSPNREVLFCWYCGKTAWSDENVCRCSAPTPGWWSRLDQMLANWKRGLAG